MPTTRQDVSDVLATRDAHELRAILEAARVATMGAQEPRALADRIADALWWHYTTPIGYLADRHDLEAIVRYAARRLGKGVALGNGDAWSQLRDLVGTLALDVGPVSLEDLDPKVRERVWPSWMPTVMFASGAGSSAGLGVSAHYVLRFAKTPIGKLLPYLPKIGPAFRVIKTSAGVASIVSGPLAVAMGVLAANEALGTNDRRLLPLLLGVGALGPDQGVQDAVVIDEAASFHEE